MGRALLIINSDVTRQKAIAWLRKAPWNTRVEFKGPQRSVDQNALMWVYLTKLATSLDWHGQRYSPEDWKDFFMHALRRARWMPTEEGGMVPIGLRTSDLSKEEMGDLITVIQEFAARHRVELDEGRDAAGDSPAAAAA